MEEYCSIDYKSVARSYRDVACRILQEGYIPESVKNGKKKSARRDHEYIIYTSIGSFLQTLEYVMSDLDIPMARDGSYTPLAQYAIGLFIHEGVFEPLLVSDKIFALKILALAYQLPTLHTNKETCTLLTSLSVISNHHYASRVNSLEGYVYKTPLYNVLVFKDSKDIVGLSSKLLRLPHWSRKRGARDILSIHNPDYKLVVRLRKVLDSYNIKFEGQSEIILPIDKTQFKKLFNCGAFAYGDVIIYPEDALEDTIAHEQHHRDKGEFSLTFFDEAITAYYNNSDTTYYQNEMHILEIMFQDIPGLEDMIEAHLEHGKVETEYAVYFAIVQTYGLAGFAEFLSLYPRLDNEMMYTHREQKVFTDSESYHADTRMELLKNVQLLLTGKGLNLSRPKYELIRYELNWLKMNLRAVISSEFSHEVKLLISEYYISLYSNHLSYFHSYSLKELFDLGNEFTILGGFADLKGGVIYLKKLNSLIKRYLSEFSSQKDHEHGYGMAHPNNLENFKLLHNQLFDLLVNTGTSPNQTKVILTKFWAKLISNIPTQPLNNWVLPSKVNFTRFKANISPEQRVFFEEVSGLDLTPDEFEHQQDQYI